MPINLDLVFWFSSELFWFDVFNMFVFNCSMISPLALVPYHVQNVKNARSRPGRTTKWFARGASPVQILCLHVRAHKHQFDGTTWSPTLAQGWRIRAPQQHRDNGISFFSQFFVFVSCFTESKTHNGQMLSSECSNTHFSGAIRDKSCLTSHRKALKLKPCRPLSKQIL